MGSSYIVLRVHLTVVPPRQESYSSELHSVNIPFLNSNNGTFLGGHKSLHHAVSGVETTLRDLSSVIYPAKLQRILGN